MRQLVFLVAVAAMIVTGCGGPNRGTSAATDNSRATEIGPRPSSAPPEVRPLPTVAANLELQPTPTIFDDPYSEAAQATAGAIFSGASATVAASENGAESANDEALLEPVPTDIASELPSDSVRRVWASRTPNSNTIWVLVGDLLYESTDGGRTYTLPYALHDILAGYRDSPDLFSGSVTLYPGAIKDTVVAEFHPAGSGSGPPDKERLVVYVASRGGSTYSIELPKGAHEYALAPDFAVSGRVLVVGGAEGSTTNLWYSEDAGSSFRDMSLEQGDYASLTDVLWTEEGIWILQSGDDDSEGRVGDTYFARTPRDGWQEDDGWKRSGEDSTKVVARRAFVGPELRPCLLVEDFNQTTGALFVSGTQYVTCKKDGQWARLQGWPGGGERGLRCFDEATTGDVFDRNEIIRDSGEICDYTTDGSIYAPREDGLTRFESPGYEEEKAFPIPFPDLPSRIGVTSHSVSADGVLYVGTDGGLFKSLNQGKTWTEVSDPAAPTHRSSAYPDTLPKAFVGTWRGTGPDDADIEGLPGTPIKLELDSGMEGKTVGTIVYSEIVYGTDCRFELKLLEVTTGTIKLAEQGPSLCAGGTITAHIRGDGTMVVLLAHSGYHEPILSTVTLTKAEGENNEAPTPQPPDDTITLYADGPVDSPGVNMRTEPSTGSKILIVIPKGEAVKADRDTVSGDDGHDWYNVTYASRRGFIRSDLLRSDP